MNSLFSSILENIEILNLTCDDEKTTSGVAKIAFNSVLKFINLNFNSFFNFSSLNHIIVDITLGEYLCLIKNSNLYSQINVDDAIKTISEGDVSITYSDSTQSYETKFDLLIEHFLNKKKDLLSFKSVTW